MTGDIRTGYGLDRRAAWLLAALIAIGAFLRLFDLDAIAFRWDEDLSSLAAKAIAEHGFPELPSGMVYIRSLPFLYVLAASGTVFGFTEWALRMPAALFGIATVPLVFMLGKRLFGVSVGLWLAAIVALSSWDIEFSRYARMYAPFQFFYLLTLFWVWRYRIEERSTAGGVLAVVAALIAVSLHALGYTLAIVFLVPPLLAFTEVVSKPRRLMFPLAASAVVALFFFLSQRITDAMYGRAAALANAAGAAGLEELPVDDEGGAGGIIGFLGGIIEQFRFPELPAFTALQGVSTLGAAAAIVIPLAIALAFCALRQSARPAVGSWLALPFIGLCCGLQLFNVALLALLGLAFSKRCGLRALREPDVLTGGLLIAVSFVVWLSIALGLHLVDVDGGIGADGKAAVETLLNFPSFFVFWGFPKEYPLLSIPAAIGAAWAFDRAARPQPDRAALYMLIVFALPIVLNGVFETRYQNHRYNVPFGPLYFMFAALGVVRWRDVVASWRASSPPARQPRLRPGIVTAALALLILAIDINPLRSWAVTRPAYAEKPLNGLFATRDFLDFRSASDYVEEHAGPNDAVIAFDCREYYNYLGRLDYCLASGTYRSGDEIIQTYFADGMRRDSYLATPMIMNADELAATLARHRGSTFLVASDSMWDDPGRVTPDLRAFMERSGDHIVFTAQDGDTKVYRF